jgi:DNA invertase Pin-like site-specific DNA recombinase
MLIGYARGTKTEAQGEAAQVAALTAAGCEKIFRETTSGGRWDHPEFSRMIEELRPEDVVIVSQLDCLAGALADLIYAIEKIATRGASFRSISEAIDISGKTGEQMRQVIQSFAGFERAKLKVRMAKGQKSARARGAGGGRSPKLSPTQQQEIMDMLSVGRSAADLARLFRVHRATISRLASKAHRADIAAKPDVR